MKIKLVQIFLWLIIQASLFAQPQKQIDSLETLLVSAKGAERSLILSRLSALYQRTSLDKSIALDNENLELQFRLNIRRDASSTLNNLGVNYYMKGNYPLALNYFEQSLALREEFNDTANIVKTLNNLGVLSQVVGNYEKALAFFQKSLLFKMSLSDTLSIAKTLSNIGVIYLDLHKYEDAGKFMHQALSYYYSLNDSSGIAVSYNNLGQLFDAVSKPDSALIYYSRSLEIKRKIGDERGIGNTLNNMGMIYADKKLTNQAVVLFEEALLIRKKLGDNFGLSSTYNNMANTYLAEKKFAKALEKYNQSTAIAMQGNLKGMLERNYAGLARLYDQTGKTNEALKFYKLLDAIKDSIFKEDLNKQLSDLNLKYETEKAKKENEILTQKNQIQELQLKVSDERQIKLYAVILLLFAGSIVVVLVMRNRNNKKLNDQLQLSNQQLEIRIKQRTKEIEEANKTKDQFFSIIAHDLKSPFNALLGLSVMLDDNYETLTDPERKEFIHYLREAVDTLYQLLENLLNWSVSQRGVLQLFPSKLQINNVIEDVLLLFSQQAQIKNISLRFENKTPEPAYADAETVKTILRNLISNAIKFSPLGGNVIIKTALHENPDGSPMYEVHISDGGVGIPPEKQEIIFENPMEVKTKGTSNEKGTGLGLLICKDFVNKNNGQISLKSEPGKGSTFIFTLPLFKNQ